MSKPGKKKKALFVLEIIVLVLFIGGLYVYGQITSRLQKIGSTPIANKEQEIAINPSAPTMTGYKTYALFGIDHREQNAELSGQNSDTIIIASVNNDTKDVKLVSVYRDTLLNIGSNDTYSKANAAYAYGGAEQAITMLNTNLDLNITDYATVDFNALTEVIDCLDGLDIPMSYAEIVHMNNYCVETAEETGKSYTPVELPETVPEDQEAIIGTYHLNGVQATSYCRIRYTSNLDMGRTERQRMVIQMIVAKAKKAGLTTLFDIMDKVFPMVTTSLTSNEILSLIPTMLGYSVDDTIGFPMDYKFSNAKGSIIVATSLESNVIQLHKFLYGTEDYTPSAEVIERSNQILKIVDGDQLEDEATQITEDTENTTTDSFIWQDTSSSYTSTDTGNDYSYTGTDTGNDNNYGYGDNNYEPDYGGNTGGNNDYSYDDGGNYGGDTGGDYEPDYGGDTGNDYEPDTGGDTGGDYEPDYGGDTGGDYDYGGDDYSDDFGDGDANYGENESYE